ncbi:MAG: hypothetical protein GF333_01135 [Candidatus Omnitrophica bacterium]|nr:hypothetical protein [Candidatus Omnitrophota bacterium]
MSEIVKLLGIVFMAEGVAYLIRPQILRRWLVFWQRGNRILWSAPIAFIVGIFLLFAASQCRLSFVITLFGVIAVLKGALILLLRSGGLQPIMGKIERSPDPLIRVFALVTCAVGVVFIYAA